MTNSTDVLIDYKASDVMPVVISNKIESDSQVIESLGRYTSIIETMS